MRGRLPIPLLPLFLGALAGSPAAGQVAARTTPQQRYFEWTDLLFEPAVYAARRTSVMQQLRRTGGGVLLVPSADGVSQGESFRQLDDFMYFTGLEVPRSVLALDVAARRAVLFAPRRDPRFESAGRPNDFPGRPIADDPELQRRSGIDTVLPRESLDSAMAAWVTASRVIRLDAAESGDGSAATIPMPTTDFVTTWSPEQMLARHVRTRYPTAPLRSASAAVAAVRMVKGSEEIDIIRRAASITAQAIIETAGYIRDGVSERELEAELEAVYKRRGAQRLAFASIIKSGPNSLWPWRILAAHYDRRNRSMHDGELVILDVGTELDGYVSDVGRTFPVSGRFTTAQRDKLEMVTRASDAIITAIRPGIRLSDLTRTALETIPAGERKYMQTSSYFGHHLGLSTGDPSVADAVLEPGMVFTVEPWYYNHDLGISVFIEDMVVVTESGVEVLTASLPRSAEDLERLIHRSGG